MVPNKLLRRLYNPCLVVSLCDFPADVSGRYDLEMISGSALFQQCATEWYQRMGKIWFLKQTNRSHGFQGKTLSRNVGKLAVLLVVFRLFLGALILCILLLNWHTGTSSTLYCPLLNIAFSSKY